MKKLIPIKDIALKKSNKASDVAKQMLDSGGFTAKSIGVSVEILKKMINDKNCTKFLSFPACIVSTGARGIIKDMIKKKFFDAIITTCGTLDHDLARIWRDYCHGDFLADDAKLHARRIHRLGNVFIPVKNYGEILEEKMQPILKELWNEDKKDFSTSELVREFGKKLEKEKNKDSSIIYQAYKNKIPVFVPGITDGAFGTQLWMFWQEHKDFGVNVFKDEQELSDIIFDAKKTGALMIGGGISKHHTIWWNQFRGGLDYAVQITTATENDGSLSGARLSEAISWGKINKRADYIDIICDATVALPIIYAALCD